MIEVDRLSKYFGPILAVDRVSFTIDQGEIVGFLGPNGAGKSTTMRILTGYLPASSGIAKVAGFDVMENSLEVRRRIGYLPESVPLYGEMRVEEYVHFRAKLKGVPRKERLGRVDYCLDRCRLKEVRRRLLQTLSKGYRQRVGLADAMVGDPQILILDEPTSGLDPLQIRETLALIKELGERRTVLLSTHILSEVEAVCERVIIIAAGRVGLSKTLDEIESESSTLVEVQGPEDDIVAAVSKLDHVRGVIARPQDDGWTALRVETTGEDDVRESIGKTVVGRGWPLRRLERKRRRLEDAFFDVLRAQDPLQAEPPRQPVEVPTNDTYTAAPSESPAPPA
jgi:ABC-2 type transport system ATP-binding protein